MQTDPTQGGKAPAGPLPDKGQPWVDNLWSLSAQPRAGILYGLDVLQVPGLHFLIYKMDSHCLFFGVS